MGEREVTFYKYSEGRKGEGAVYENCLEILLMLEGRDVKYKVLKFHAKLHVKLNLELN